MPSIGDAFHAVEVLAQQLHRHLRTARHLRLLLLLPGEVMLRTGGELVSPERCGYKARAEWLVRLSHVVEGLR